MNIVSVEGLTFDYPGRRALDNVSFALPANSITALVGPNGAGKTTLMRCLAALERPLLGRIELNGVDVLAQPRACHRQVGYLSDFFGLYDDLTVYQCLLFVAESYRVANPEQAVVSTAESLRLTPYLQTKAGNLSRGWRQRLGIAQAIIHKPRMLMLDEPASGLDPEARDELAFLLRQLQADGITVMVSSHILSELSEYSTHMLVLEQGRVVNHCPIGNGAQAACELVIEIAEPHEQFESIVRALPEFSVQSMEASAAKGIFQGNDEARAALLRQLVDNGLAVCRFTSVEQDMQQVYLDIIRNERGVKNNG